MNTASVCEDNFRKCEQLLVFLWKGAQVKRRSAVFLLVITAVGEVRYSLELCVYRQNITPSRCSSLLFLCREPHYEIPGKSSAYFSEAW